MPRHVETGMSHSAQTKWKKPFKKARQILWENQGVGLGGEEEGMIGRAQGIFKTVELFCNCRHLKLYLNVCEFSHLGGGESQDGIQM